MSTQDFYAAFQIDCEATQHAIDDKALGERASATFADLLEGEQFKGTFFVTPGDLKASGPLYRGLAARGHEVGLHLHPADMGYEEFLGVYGPKEQRNILALAADEFAQQMGVCPAGLCIGYVSANDHTFGVLAELGFRHGMLSLPSRVLPQCASVWAGAPLDIHYANPYNRILPGTLDLVNVPLTLDPDSRMWGGAQPQDLRIELVDAKNHWYTIKKEVDRKFRNNVPVKYLLSLTHNIYDYSNVHDFRRETLFKMIGHIRGIIGGVGGAVIGATVGQIADSYRKAMPLQTVQSPKLVLDARGRS